MTEEKKPAPESSETNDSKPDNSPAAPVEENKEAEKVEIKEKIDPRIVNIVGEDKIKSAYGEKPEKEEKPADGMQEEKKEVPETEPKENREDKAENKEKEQKAEMPPVTSPEAKPTRLDRRLAARYVRNLHLMGETNIPSEEDILADLKKYSREEKENALHFHMQQEHKLRGEKITGNEEFDEEDKEAIQDAEREAIRQEVLAEEHKKQTEKKFIEFIDNHPELDESKKDFKPRLAKAVETLWRGGMPIEEAYETVMEEVKQAKEAEEAKIKKEKDKAFSGVVSGTGQTGKEEKELDWNDVSRIQKEDPQLYKKMLREGKFKHLM